MQLAGCQADAVDGERSAAVDGARGRLGDKEPGILILEEEPAHKVDEVGGYRDVDDAGRHSRRIASELARRDEDSGDHGAVKAAAEQAEFGGTFWEVLTVDAHKAAAVDRAHAWRDRMENHGGEKLEAALEAALEILPVGRDAHLHESRPVWLCDALDAFTADEATGHHAGGAEPAPARIDKPGAFDDDNGAPGGRSELRARGQHQRGWQVRELHRLKSRHGVE